MATPAITGSLLQSFGPIFLFLLVFTIIYAMLQAMKFLGDNKGIHAFIALLVGIFAAFMSGSVSGMLTFLIPWFTVIFIIVVLVLIIFAMFGASQEDFATLIKGHGGVQWTIIIVSIIIVLIGLTQSFGQSSLGITTEGMSTDPTSNGEVVYINEEGTQIEGSTNSNGFVRTSPTGDTSTGDFNQNAVATFFHPKIIGTIFILGIGAIAVSMLTRKIV